MSIDYSCSSLKPSLRFAQNFFTQDLAADLTHDFAGFVDFADQLDRGEMSHAVFA